MFDDDGLLIFQQSYKVLDELGDDSLAPTFAMIDPFGLKGVPLSTIARIAKHERCEVMFSLMTESMVRFMSGDIFPPLMDEVFGTDKWRGALYLESGDKALFLRDLYAEQLRSVGFSYVPPGFELRDEGNKVEYYLMFGTKNLTGLTKMKDAMWAVDKSGNYRFSGFEANSIQMTLI
ncbi:MAG: three-Cys-motif partner protein TcmP, partial [Candidatus Hydrogenedentes bacterium]|nr:three-Cys-motif partner protein TcmP [Candidatus Hydrogenedentota bacterium]